MKKHLFFPIFIVGPILLFAASGPAQYPEPSYQHQSSIIQQSQRSNNISICALRVSFLPDDSEATTGDGRFLQQKSDTICSSITLDPPPHDRNYFRDHIRSLANYYGKVSKSAVSIDTLNSAVFPVAQNGSYQLSHTMDYYHPFLESDSVDLRLAELFIEAIQQADEEVYFPDYDLVVVFHAGVGQDFDLVLDPTPRDIPSAFLNQNDLAKFADPGNPAYTGVPVENGSAHIRQGILLPETQNHLLYENWEEVFGGATDPCSYQIALNGTFAFMFGFYLGLPGLYDTETGQTGIGKFGLMDQGSANLNGLAPPLPSAWSRIFLGWEQPVVAGPDQSIALLNAEENPDSGIWKVPINENEYFLVENRYAEVHPGVSLDSMQYRIYQENGEERWPSLLPLIRDSLGAVFAPGSGVLLSLPRYDVGLPGSGLLIWHVDETVLHEKLADNRVNTDRERRAVDLEEGDGAQDLGYDSQVFGSNIDVGWYFDPWFAGNDGFWDLNPDYPQDSIASVGFTDATNPSSRSNANANTGIRIDQIGAVGRTMQFRIAADRAFGNFPMLLGTDGEPGEPLLLPRDGQSSVLCIVADDSLLIVTADGTLINAFASGFADGFTLAHPPILHTLNDGQTISVTGRNQAGDFSCYRYTLSGDYALESTDSEEWSGYRASSNPLVVNNEILGGFQKTPSGSYVVRYDNAEIPTATAIIQVLGADSDLLCLSDAGTVYRLRVNPMELETLLDLSVEPIGDAVYNPGVSEENAGLVLCTTTELISVSDLFGISGDPTINSYPLTDFYPHPILMYLDADDDPEIIIADSTHIYAFTESLVLQSNFPIRMPNLYAEKSFEPYLFSAYVDGDDAPDIVASLSDVGLLAFDKNGRLIDGFPVTLPRHRSRSNVLLETAEGTILATVSSDGRELMARRLAAQTLDELSWRCYGFDAQRSFQLPYGRGDYTPPETETVLDEDRIYNWPNPVKGTETFFRFYVNRDCEVDIDIFDLAGNFVAAIREPDPVVDDYNELRWELSGIQSGVYFAVVKAGSGGEAVSKIVKVMVIR